MNSKWLFLGIAALGGIILLSTKKAKAGTPTTSSSGYSYTIDKINDTYYAISGTGETIYTGSDAYSAFNYAVVAGGTSFFVRKGINIQFPAANNNIPGVTIVGEDWNTVVLSVENPTINYLGGFPGCTLTNVGIQDAFHDDPAYPAGSIKKIKYWTNVRRENATAIANWGSMAIRLSGGEPGIDSPIIGILNSGAGDSVYYGMHDAVEGARGGAATIRIADYSNYYNNESIANIKIDDLNASAQTAGARNYLWITGTPGDYLKVTNKGILTSTLKGEGNGYVCTDSVGKLYRSKLPCI